MAKANTATPQTMEGHASSAMPRTSYATNVMAPPPDALAAANIPLPMDGSPSRTQDVSFCFKIAFLSRVDRAERLIGTQIGCWTA